MLAKSPRIINSILHAVIGVGICGHLVKLYKPNESNYLFDGASLVLFMIAIILYGTSVMTGTILICGRTNRKDYDPLLLANLEKCPNRIL
jgi:ER membrane protein SH3